MTDERSGHRAGAQGVAGDAARGVGRVETTRELELRRTSRRAPLVFPQFEAALVQANRSPNLAAHQAH